MARGYVSLVLQAHLPFVRHPSHDRFLEEDWLFEAISETYLPLLRAFRRLDDQGIPFRITLAVSPTLASMLADKLLQERYVAHLERLLELADMEIKRTAEDPEFNVLARMYKDLFSQNYADFTDRYQRNILWGFLALQKRGYLEIITSAATHGFLPLYQHHEDAVRAQVQVGVESHRLFFGRDPKGLWIPECGYYPGLEAHLQQFGLRYFFCAAHGILFGSERPKYGVYAPVACPNGIAAFGRDLASAHAVWSSTEGYPGDLSYREFYRDIGFDLPLDYIGPYLHNNDIRVNTGFKYYAVTGNTEQKRVYRPSEAEKKVDEHAENFVYNRLKQVEKLGRHMDRTPIIVCPYDAELFGHWWFEGPQWIESLVRKLSERQDELRMVTPSEYLAEYPENQVSTPSFSSWGNKGYAEVWLDGSNDWVYRHTHKAVERMRELVVRFPNEKGLKERALNQAAREVLLSQASDWPFIMKTGTTVPYAVKRVREHIHNFTEIYTAMCRNTVNTEWLTRVERRNNIFPYIDYRIFAPN